MTRVPPEERPSAGQLQNQIVDSAGGVSCPKCGRKMMAEKTKQWPTAIERRRQCYCGHKVVTMQARERIVRDVKQHDSDDKDSNSGILQLRTG